MNGAIFQQVGNVITRDRNNKEGIEVETGVLFVPGELVWGNLASAASEGLEIKGASWITGPSSTHR